MDNYTDNQRYAFALLLLFILIFLFKIWRFFTASSSKRFLKRYRSIRKLKKLSWESFETLSLHFFREQGWKVTGNTLKGADGGVDLWMKKRGTEAIVQCKKYEDARVTIKVIREMYGLMHEHGVDKAFVITTSEFTKECYRFVEDKEIELINGERLVEKIKRLTG
jgi:restriction system protein